MRGDDRVDSGIGLRLKRYRDAAGLTQTQLAQLSGIPQSRISEYEKGVHRPDISVVKELARHVQVLPSYLLADAETRRSMAIDFSGNEKPIRLGDISLDRVYSILNDECTPLEIKFTYTHEPFVPAPKMRRIYDALDRRAKDMHKGRAYWDGPCARLLRITEENTRLLSSGIEQRGIVLHLGPISWFQITVHHQFLDEPGLFPDDKSMTIRKALASEKMLYSFPRDFSWCPLPNPIDVSLIPITTDGYGIVQRRSDSVSFNPRMLGSGVCEQVHPWIDEAPQNDPWRRLNPLMTPKEAMKYVDREYEPKPGNVPSLFLAASRGLKEELSPFRNALENTPHRFKFLNVLFGLETFGPELVGVVELPFSRELTHKMMQEERGRDHGDAIAFEFVKLDSSDRRTMRMIEEVEDWSVLSLAALMIAIKYWHAQHPGSTPTPESTP